MIWEMKDRQQRSGRALFEFLLLLQLLVFGVAEAASSPEWAEVIAAGGVYFANDGSEVMRVRQHDTTDLSAIEREVSQQELPTGAEIVSTTERGKGIAKAVVTVFKEQNKTRILSVSVASRSGGGALSLAHTVDPNIPQAASRLSQASASLLGSAMQGDSIGGQNSEGLEVGIEPVKRKRINAVEHVVFDLDYTYGVGGAVIPEYTPVVLFGDGTACKCLESAIDEIDTQRIQRTSPNKVGTWRKSGRNYEVRWPGAKKAEILKPSVGPPEELPSARALQGRYQSISGGGNTALGGTVLTAAVDDLTFYRDGSFSQSNANLLSSGAGIASGKRGRAGTWTLNGSSLTLIYGNGETVRTTVFYSGKRKMTASFGRYGVLWIGGENFKRVE